MTAFADRTVVTIAVRGPLLRFWETTRERTGLLRLPSEGSHWANSRPGNEERTLEQCRAKSPEGLWGNCIAGCEVWEALHLCFLRSSLFLQVPKPRGLG